MFLGICIQLTMAQSVDLINNAVIGGNQDDYGYDLIKTADGGFFVVGNSKSNDFDIPGNYGGNDVFAAKLDADGNVEWASNYGGSSEDFARSVVATEDGYAICGSTFSSDNDLTSNNGSRDIWVVKINMTGEIEWQKNFGGDTVEFSNDIIHTSDGGFLVQGHTKSSNMDVSANYGGYDVWLLKLDANGNIEWEKNYGGTLDDFSAASLEIEDGYIIGSYTYSNDEDVSGNHIDTTTQADYWIFRIDFSGNIIWQKCLGGTKAELLNDIILTDDNLLVAVGTSRSEDGDLSGHYGAPSRTDVWLVKLDLDGVLLSQKHFGGSNNDAAYGITEDEDGGFVVTGESNSTDIDLTLHYGTTTLDVWTFKTDPDLNLVWQTTSGGSQDDAGRAIIALGDTLYVGFGYTKSIDYDITFHYGVSGNFDSWLFWIGPDVCSVEITANPNSVTVCEGGTVTLSVGASDDVTSYSWIFTSGPTINTTTNTLTLTGVTAAYATTYQVVVNGPCGSDTSALATINVTSFGTVNITPSTTQDLCTTGTVNFSTTTTGAGYSYQWFKDGAAITGATSSSYVATSAGLYHIQVSSMGGTCVGVSAEVLVESELPVVTISSPDGTNLCASGTLLLSTDFSPDFSYQWYKDGFAIIGATTSSLLVTLPGNYVVVAGIASCIDTSSAVAIINTNPIATMSSDGDPDLCFNTSITLNASTGIGYLYQWMEDGVLIPGATTSSLTALSVGFYEVIVSNAAGCADTSAALEVYNSCDTSNAIADINGLHSILLYPNPNTGSFEIMYYSDNNFNADLVVRNVHGEMVYTNSIQLFTGDNILPVALSDLSEGMYLVQIIYEQHFQVSSFILTR